MPREELAVEEIVVDDEYAPGPGRRNELVDREVGARLSRVGRLDFFRRVRSFVCRHQFEYCVARIQQLVGV